ncbi:MAG TPA: isoaspartyl peptidase/L-asparaginase [Candidatus Limnocylindria bacterium]|nr:isoaspartyl peptidase/L-asparaginase [Candidatus Limnocylindria bacterium]
MRPRVPVIPTIVSSGNGAKALPDGMRVLAAGGSALDAVEACARVTEADPEDRTVGLGGHPNVLGEVELDASIVDGTTRRAGAVAALTGFLHPISVARAVMERLPHVMLAGDGAARFAREIGAEAGELLTAETRRLWLERLGDAGTTEAWIAREKDLARIVWKAAIDELGTVNFLAVDRRGRFASAVTTSGWAYKYPGRVGDSPIPGAGNYCDSRYGAAACTGFGELAMRTLTAKTAVDRLSEGWTAARVARAAIRDVNALESAGTRMNIVVLAKDGTHAAASARADVKYAFITAEMDAPETRPRAHVPRRARG